VTVTSRIALSAMTGGGSEPVQAPRSERATWALWLGLAGVGLGFMLMFIVLTPAAIVCGVRGLREIHAQPELTGRGRAWWGIVLGLVAPFLWVGLFVALLVDGVL
jgi:hypothetical protein